MARFVHVSDTHLGYQAYGRLTEDGLNQREVDVQDAFRRVVDWCVEDRPDFVVHSGDLFDSPRPSNRAIAFALAQIRRLDTAGIPTVLLSGNHDAPRLRETGSIFRIFEGMENVHSAYQGGVERFRIDCGSGAVVVHAVPQAVSQEAFQADLESLEPVAGIRNILVVHGTVAGVDGLFTNELNDLLIPQSALGKDFDYVALGHFHGYREVAPNAHYAGSTERTSIKEWDQEKGFTEVELGEAGLGLRRHSTGARPMADVGPVDAARLGPEALVERVVERLKRVVEPGAVIRVTVTGIDRPTLKAMDLDAVRAAAEDALHFMFNPVVSDPEQSVQLPAALGHLADELSAFIASYPIEGLDRERVRVEAVRLLGPGEGEDAP